MERKDAILLLILSSIGIAGYLISGIWGGIMIGASQMLIIVWIIGKRQLKKQWNQLEKRIKDHFNN